MITPVRQLRVVDNQQRRNKEYKSRMICENKVGQIFDISYTFGGMRLYRDCRQAKTIYIMPRSCPMNSIHSKVRAATNIKNDRYDDHSIAILAMPFHNQMFQIPMEEFDIGYRISFRIYEAEKIKHLLEDATYTYHGEAIFASEEDAMLAALALN